MLGKLLIFAAAFACAFAQFEDDSTVLQCAARLDVAFLVDSSSSVGEGNFELMRDFVVNVVRQLDISPELSQISVARYNSWAQPVFNFNTYTTKRDVIDAVRDVPYYGRGTMTAEGLRVVSDQLLQSHQGWRENDVPTIVIVITDGRTSDAAMLPKMARQLRRKVTRVIAVGIGRVDEEELSLIASRPSSDNVIKVEEFSQLVDLVLDVAEKTCDVAGDENECKNDNGGCEVNCVNVLNGWYCECPVGYNIVDETDCTDINECTVDNGGCSDTCENTPGSYECKCDVGFIVGPDRNCEPDSCYGNSACQQVCTNVIGGDVDFTCSCNAGFTLNEDGRSCTDVDECAINNGGCEYTCNNTVGSYDCLCPEGLGLRADKHTCGIICHVCDRALSNEDCQEEVVCAASEKSCQTHVRSENGVVYISKMCKQTEACVNNFVQNPRTGWSPTQCNENPSGTVSVCRCCCHESYCNAPADCSLSDKIDIECEDPSLIETPVGLNISCTGNQIGDVCDLICPVGFAPVTGTLQLVCTHRPRSLEGDWVGEIGECGDIDECAINNGGCSHFCENTIGSFICSCPNDFRCELEKRDVLFIMDSSSSVKSGNFALMRDFVTNVGNQMVIGQDEVRIAILRYNLNPEKIFGFDNVTDNQDFVTKVANIPYNGRGTYTARAIKAAVEQCLTVETGRRPGVPLKVVIITDGRSRDRHDLPDALARLFQHTDEVFAIGVSNRVNEKQLLQIANQRQTHYRYVDDFPALDLELARDYVEPRLCSDAEGRHVLQPDGLNCDINECLKNNGGCSHFCNNTIGSFYCSCPTGSALIEDGLTCAFDECLEENGGCEYECLNTARGRRCLCPYNKQWDGEKCAGYNECLDENAGCSDTCQDTEDGYVCLCPEGMDLGPDQHTCETNSCFEQQFPFICDHTCTNVAGGSYVCSCNEGYMMEEDAHNCTEINECDLGNGGCEYICVNTEGSYRCECPEGLQLRNDGRTCGVSCYTCEQALNPEEECTELVVCPESEDACFTTHRVRDNVTMTWKGCRQTISCINQMIQNAGFHGEGPTQCNLNQKNAKCECCCMEANCNEGDCPYNFTLPGCPVFEAPNVIFSGVQADGTVFPGGAARVTCSPGYQYTLGGAGFVQINCIYNFVNNTSEWDGDYTLFDTCEDIDECKSWQGANCVEPSTCVNTPGSFECVCPEDKDDYVLVDGVMCERDECADEDQGGCNHNCTNTIGSYICSCAAGFSLVEDGVTCDFDECQDANGGCKQLCVNTLGGRECRCHNEGYRLEEDGETCVDIDECLVDNGGCSHFCTNLDGGYVCSCPEEMILSVDGFTCKPNPCFPESEKCDQRCRVLDEDNYVCECYQGYELLDDGTCADINECERNIANCQYNCTNFDGGYTCECPVGQALRNDNRTCGVACYVCNGAATNEECNVDFEVCPLDADACENEVRMHGGRKQIFKRCKQSHACNNNHIQNPRDAWLPTQCNGEDVNDVCRCCCTGHLCNYNEKPCRSNFKCNIKQADIIVVVDSSSSVKPRNFGIIKNFLFEFIGSLPIGLQKTRVGLVRYNNEVDVRFNLNEFRNKEDILDAIDSTPYNGRGTLTGQALDWVVNNGFSAENGGREGVDRHVITLTDGRSRDDVSGPSEALRAMGVTTYAIGAGAKLHRGDLDTIAGDDSRVFIAKAFEELSSVIISDIQESVCADVDECLSDNGGCSHDCTNTKGSFYCGCPEGMALSEDMRNCFEVGNETLEFTPADECAKDNGGCDQICIDTYSGYNCSCEDGYALREDLHSCGEVNECADEFTDLCSNTCTNTIGSFFCDCPETHRMGEDQLNCAPRDGDADCPVGYTSVATSCVQVLAEPTTRADAQIACENAGARLYSIRNPGSVRIISKLFPSAVGYWTVYEDLDEDGIFVDDEDNLFGLDILWGQESPAPGKGCVIVDPEDRNRLATVSCDATYLPVCQIPREDEGFAVFSNSWQNGAQGKIYFPTGANYFRVVFPVPIKTFTGWFGSVVMKDGDKAVIVTQSEHDVSSSNGEMQFVLDFGRNPFASYQITVTKYFMEEGL